MSRLQKRTILCMIRAAWKTKKKKSKSTVLRRAKKLDLGPKRVIRELRLDPEKKAGRKAWGEKHRRISKRTWEVKCLAIDEKRFKYHTSAKARRMARMMTKRLVWRKSSEGVTYAAPDRYKHRQGEVGFHVMLGTGNGKVQAVVGLPSRLSGALYAEQVKKTLAPKLRKMGEGAFLLRDGDPGSHNTKKGLKAEKDAKIKVKPQASYSPDCNPDDIHHWDWAERQLLDEERQWESKHPGEYYKETFEEFETRVLKWCKALPADLIRSTARSLHRRCKELTENGGNWVSGD